MRTKTDLENAAADIAFFADAAEFIFEADHLFSVHVG